MKVVKLLKKVKDHLELLTVWLRHCLLTETYPEFWNVLAQDGSSPLSNSCTDMPLPRAASRESRLRKVPCDMRLLWRVSASRTRTSA